MRTSPGNAVPLTSRAADGEKPVAKNQAPNTTTGRVVNAMTVDVEDYFHVRAFTGLIQPDDWNHFPPRFEANTNRVLDLFEEKRVFATFFVLGWVAERCPAIVKRMASAGHEIGSHGYGHQDVDRQTPEQFRADVRRTKLMLENLSQRPVRGYRAPTFSIGRRTWWAYEILAREGYAYSSSIYPIAHDLYGMPEAPRRPFHPIAEPLLEIPLTTLRLFNRNFPAAGGGYFRVIPYRVSRWAIAQVNGRERAPCIFYFHPWEIDPEQPRVKGAKLRSRFRHYTNLGAMRRRVARLLDDFSWGRMDQVFLSNGNG